MKQQKRIAEGVIHDLSTDGRGVLRVGETVYFVRDALPGDRVRVQLDTESRPPSAIVKQYSEWSPLRVPHPCPHAESCRGSIWGKLAYEEQLRVKRHLVERTLRKMIGPVEILPTVPSPRPWNYRHRVSLSLWEENGHSQMGFRTEARARHGIPIHTCHLAVEAVREAVARCSTFFARTGITDLQPTPKRVHVFQTASGAGAMLIFAETLTESARRDWEQRTHELGLSGGVWLATGTKAGVVISPESVWPCPGAQKMQTRWMDQPLEIHPLVFCQANEEAAELVLATLRRWSRERPRRIIWDLYGGFGGLGLALASENSVVRVFERTALAAEALSDLAAKVGHARTEFVAGDLLRTFGKHLREITADDAIILDPPRSGAHPTVLEQIVRSRVREVVYLSCNPAKLARDLAILSRGGFHVLIVEPYDFFPQTPSIEVLVRLTRE